MLEESLERDCDKSSVMGNINKADVEQLEPSHIDEVSIKIRVLAGIRRWKAVGISVLADIVEPIDNFGETSLAKIRALNSVR